MTLLERLVKIAATNTPSDYYETRAAVAQMFPKLANSNEYMNQLARRVAQAGKLRPPPGTPMPIRLGNIKTAGLGVAGAELAGLGVLGVPSVKTLRDPSASAKEKNHAKWELGGLGVLAAHPAYETASHFINKVRPAVAKAPHLLTGH